MSLVAKSWLVSIGAAALLAGIMIFATAGTDRQPAAGPPLERVIWTVRRDRLKGLCDAIEAFGNVNGIEVFRSPALPLNISVGFKTFILHAGNSAAAKDIARPFVSIAFLRLVGIEPDLNEMALVRRELEAHLIGFEGLEFKQVGESW